MKQTLNRRFRSLVKPGGALLLPGVGNALTARIVESTGHEAMIVSGAAVSNSFLGMPDLGMLTLTELASHVNAIREVTTIPMLVDGDTGFGNAVSVGHTIRVLERAGANAIMLEDQTFPKKCGHFNGHQIVSQEEMVQKIRAATDARTDDDMMILARTDARSAHGLQAALDRAAAYQDAGADFLFVEAPLSLDEMAAIPRQVPGLHVCNMVVGGGKTPLLDRAELGRLGFAVVIYANVALQASMLAMQNALRHLRERGSVAGLESSLIPFADRQALVAGPAFDALAKKYES